MTDPAAQTERAKRPPEAFDPAKHRMNNRGRWMDHSGKSPRLVAVDPSTIPEEVKARLPPTPKAPKKPKAPKSSASRSTADVLAGASRDLEGVPPPPAAPPVEAPRAPEGAPATFESLPELDAPTPGAPSPVPSVPSAPALPGLEAPGPPRHLPGCWKAASVGDLCPCCGETVYPLPPPEKLARYVGLLEMMVAGLSEFPRPFTDAERAMAAEVVGDALQRYGAGPAFKHAPLLALAGGVGYAVKERRGPKGEAAQAKFIAEAQRRAAA